MRHNGVERWRRNLKTALASTIALSRDRGLTTALERGPDRPLVLGYHRVVADFDEAVQNELPGMLTSAAMFERHLDFIGQHFRFVSLDEIGSRLAAGEPFTERVAAVTFDDGYRDVYEHAFPILKRKGIPAAVFVVTDLVGRQRWQVHDRLYRLVARAYSHWADPARELSRLLTDLDLPASKLPKRRAVATDPVSSVSTMLPVLSRAEVDRLMEGIEASVGNGFKDVPLTLTWPMLSDMLRAGFTIGSHTCRHVCLPAESDSTVARELVHSKRTLEERLGVPISHFAYPDGQFTAREVSALADAGYRFGYTACQHGEPNHQALTIERLLLWEGSSVDADGHFSPALLNCQTHDLWPTRCSRVHHA